MGVYYNDSGTLVPVAGGEINSFCPIGTIVPYGGTIAPEGYMICNGAAVSRTEYSELFAVIGTSFGSGDGSTTFNIPDLRGEFLRGAGTNGHTNQGSGGAVGEHQDASEHLNTASDTSPNLIVANNSTINVSKMDSVIEHPIPSAYVGGNIYSPENRIYKYTSRPTNTSVNYIIKAKIVSNEMDWQQQAERYSTSEVFTGKIWIDGKPIYRKVYHDVLLDGPNTAEWYMTNVPVLANIENIVKLDALRQWDSTKTTRILTAGAMTIAANPSDDYLRYMWMTGTTYHGYYDIIIEYTKSA